MPRLLIMNCIEAEEPRRGFDQAIAPVLGELFGHDYRIAHLCGPDPLPAASDYSHLILSGSELSASRDNPRDSELCDQIREFVHGDRNVFGICYGHQMIGRALIPTPCCRRTATPEFGWKTLTLGEDRLYAGIDDLIAVHSHYDELHDLPEPFRVIASTKDCAVQAFAYGTRAVWGTQFHPEQTHELGKVMLADNLRTEARAPELFVDELDNPARLRNNRRLFENFFRATAV